MSKSFEKREWAFADRTASSVIVNDTANATIRISMR